MELLYDLVVQLLGKCPRELKALCPKNLYTNMQSSITHNGEKGETTQMSINEGMDDMDISGKIKWIKWSIIQT